MVIFHSLEVKNKIIKALRQDNKQIRQIYFYILKIFLTLYAVAREEEEYFFFYFYCYEKQQIEQKNLKINKLNN